MKKKRVIILIIFVFLLSVLVLSPSTEEKLKEKNIGNLIKQLPATVERIGSEEVLPIWQKTWEWLKENIWLRVVDWTKPEIEKRKEYLKQGLEQEKEELKEEIQTEAPRAGQSLWQKFKELIKKN